VANDVLRRRSQPTIVVGPGFMHERLGKGVVGCVDETPPSAAVLPVALRWSGMLGDPLTVITVAEPVPEPLAPGAAPHRRFGPDGDVEEFLEALVTPLRAQAVPVETRAVFDPISPASGLRHHLWDNPSALVTVGSYLRRGLKRTVLGTVAAGMIRQSSVPTLVVPQPNAA
jgi:nucleotide-binding universal stress UspA family protein